jgi:2-phospho-L-lactate/phosphoenolpyruvate guanylyltransferase
MRATAVIPVKRFTAAKRRLERGLTAAERRDLAELMLIDVLDAVGQCSMVDRVIVVSGEPLAREQAREREFDCVLDVSDAGHSQAALLGIEQATAHRAGCVALLPADCPLLDPGEIDGLLGRITAPSVTIVPDRHGTGTNALLLQPPDAIRPAFGPGSCMRHWEAARAAGVPHAVEKLDSLRLDLDTPADLIALTRELEAGRGRAPNTARALGL